MCSAYCFLKFDRTQNHVCQWLRQTPVIMLALLPVLSICYKLEGLHLFSYFHFHFPFCFLLLLKVASNRHFAFPLSGTFHLAKHYSFFAPSTDNQCAVVRWKKVPVGTGTGPEAYLRDRAGTGTGTVLLFYCAFNQCSLTVLIFVWLVHSTYFNIEFLWGKIYLLDTYFSV